MLYGGAAPAVFAGISSGREKAAVAHHRNHFNRSADKINNHITEIINECGSKLTKTTIEGSHRNLATGQSSAQIAVQ